MFFNLGHYRVPVPQCAWQGMGCAFMLHHLICFHLLCFGSYCRAFWGHVSEFLLDETKLEGASLENTQCVPAAGGHTSRWEWTSADQKSAKYSLQILGPCFTSTDVFLQEHYLLAKSWLWEVRCQRVFGPFGDKFPYPSVAGWVYLPALLILSK